MSVFSADVRKKDDLQAPIVKDDFRLCLLRETADLIEDWSRCGRAGFTSPTALAWHQTQRALVELFD